MSRTITIEHNGTTYYGQIAKVTSTHLGSEGHGILTAYLHCDGDGWGTGVGGMGLDSYDEERRERIPTAYGFDHIVSLYRTVGVDSWEKVPGREVIVLFDGKNSLGARAVGIAHISDESKVLILSEHADEWRSRNEGVLA